MTNEAKIMAESRRFRLVFARYTLALLVVLAAAAWVWDRVAAQGVLLGGLAGLIGFWMMARAVERLAIHAPEKIQFALLKWTAVRMGLYAAAFIRAFTLDREEFHGLLGAVAGFLAIRVVLMYLGLTGRDLAPPEEGGGASAEPSTRD
jgi:hypothetical protein